VATEQESDSQASDLAQAIDRFCRAAVSKGDFAYPASKDHKLHAEMGTAAREILSKGTIGLAAFMELLSHASPHVRSWVSAQLLASGHSEALPVAEALAQEAGTLGLSARMVVELYNREELRSPFGTNSDA